MRTSPGQTRNYLIIDNPSADHCTVLIVEEHISLRFERDPDGVTRSNKQAVTRYDPDAADRATRLAFGEARHIAIRKMAELQSQEKRRSGYAEPLITYSSVIECSLSYAGSKYSFGCNLVNALSWEGLRLTAEEHQDQKLYLDDHEWRKLKQRAFSKIQMRRKFNDCYGEEGLHPFTENKTTKLAPALQLSFAL